MKSLSLGGICSDFTCAKCCKDTQMLLSKVDIERIITLGFNAEDFCFINDDGFFELKNVDGHCVFLESNKCLIYLNRPQGCRFYPIIFDLDANQAILDSDCPLIKKISSSVVKSFEKDLRRFARKLVQEKNER